MKIEDINKFKGMLKSALLQWGNSKIDEIFPGKPQIKAFAKNGFNNILIRSDEKINKGIDTFMLFAASEDGVIDTDQLIDMGAEMFKELEPHRYELGWLNVEVGKGEVSFHMPQSMLTDLVLGKSGTLRMTTEDILELKNYLN